MTKAEELRKNLIAELAAYQLTMFGTEKGVVEEIDNLIDAVEEEFAARATENR